MNCFDHSRVVLSKEYPDSNDYINANYIDGYQQSKKFISTQSPMENITHDFWHMIWDQKTLVIAMATNATEPKLNETYTNSVQYWSETVGDSMKFENYSIKTIEIVGSADCVLTELELTNLKINQTRRVAHCRYISWPDMKLPVSSSSFINYIKFIQFKQDEMVRELGDKWIGYPWGPPIVVHCRAGTGRSGTLVAIYKSMMLFDATGTLNFLEIVMEIRKMRSHSLETGWQYRFAYQTIFEYIDSVLEISQNFDWSKL